MTEAPNARQTGATPAPSPTAAVPFGSSMRLLGAHDSTDLVAIGGAGDRTVSDLIRDAARISARLPHPSPGSHVQLVFENDRYAMAAALIAALDTGHAVALPPNTRPDSILNVLDRPDVVAVAHDLESAAGIDVPRLLGPTGAAVATSGWVREIEPTRVFATLHTSGTTRDASASTKTAGQLVGEAQGLVRELGFGCDDRFLATVSPGHIYGLLWSVLVPLTCGGVFCRETPLHAPAIASAARRLSATVLITVPAQVRALGASTDLRLDPIERVISSTAPLSNATAAKFFETHALAITEIFGSTETGGIARRDSGGTPPEPWTPLAGVTVSVGRDARLSIDSPYLPPNAERPFETGDRGAMLENGRFEHHGRIDGVVKIGGRRVSIGEVENFLRELPEVADVAVAAVRDVGGRGNRLIAALAPGNLDPEWVRSRLRVRFDESTLPRRFRFLDSLPREPNGKLQRRQLLRLFNLDADGRPTAREPEWGASKIEDEGDERRITREVRIPDDYAWFEGRFDGYPILAGAVQLKELILPTLRAGWPEAGRVHRLQRVKWSARIQPGETLRVEITSKGGEEAVLLSFRILRGETLCSSGRMRLVRARELTRTESEDGSFRLCAVIPTYDNAETIAGVVERVRRFVPRVIVVDDGSHSEGRAACDAVARDESVEVIHLDRNRGKGAAVRSGLAHARSQGFTHAFQVDADGQHDIDRMPAFIEAARASPEAFVVGYPEYDESLPALRSHARRITKFWVDLETGTENRVSDAMIGFRVYPIEATLAADTRCNRMAFDVEIAVLLARAGTPTRNLPVGVRYLSADEGGRSHFQPFRDNVRMFWLHSRLCSTGATRWCLDRLLRRFHRGAG